MVIAVYLLFGLSVLMAAATSLIGISAYKKVKRGPVQERNGIVILKNPTLYVAVVFTAVWACCFMLAGLAFKDEFPVAAIVISAVFLGVQCLVFAAVQNIKNWKVELKERSLVHRDMRGRVFEIPYDAMEFKDGMFFAGFYSRGRFVFGAGFVNGGIKVLKDVLVSEEKQLTPILEKLAEDPERMLEDRISREAEWQLHKATEADIGRHKELISAIKKAGRSDADYLADLTKGENAPEICAAVAAGLAEWDDGEMQSVLMGVLANSRDPAYAPGLIDAVAKRPEKDLAEFGKLYDKALLSTWNDNSEDGYVALISSDAGLASLKGVAERLAEKGVHGVKEMLESRVGKYISDPFGDSQTATEENACVNAMNALSKTVYDDGVKALLERASYASSNEKIYTAARELFFAYVDGKK